MTTTKDNTKGRHIKLANTEEKQIIVDNKAENEVKNEAPEAAEAEATEPSVEELLKRIAELESELKAKEDQHLRMAAEYENFRRRSREEREATYTDAVADTVGEILPIIDNLERAALYEEGDKVREGLVMIAKSVESAFEKLKVESVGKVGETFDPNLHNAVLHDEDETRGEGEIVDVFQKGYKKGNKIIRFAMVKTVN